MEKNKPNEQATKKTKQYKQQQQKKNTPQFIVHTVVLTGSVLELNHPLTLHKLTCNTFTYTHSKQDQSNFGITNE